MRAWAAAAGGLAALAAPAAPAPVLVHDSRESSPAASVSAFAGVVPGVPAESPGPVVYERVAGPWRQWWIVFEHNGQDRGIVRTGRHAGDWEMVQVRMDAAGRPVEAVYAQHSGAERCPWQQVERRGECDGRETALAGGALGLAALGLAALVRRRRL